MPTPNPPSMLWTTVFHRSAHRPPFFSTLHSLTIPSRLLYIKCPGKHLITSPTLSSTSSRPFSPTAFFAYSVANLNIANTARLTCVCWFACALPCDTAERRGPEREDEEMTGLEEEDECEEECEEE